MVYVDKYKIVVTNRLNANVAIFLAQKDGTGGITEYRATAINLKYTGSEGKFTSIYGLNAEFSFRIGKNDHDPWAEFVNAEQNDWQVRIEYTTEASTDVIFWGFLLPDEGVIPLRDRPYTINLVATDGIGLLKDINLVKPDGTAFNSHHSIIRYMAACTQATGLQLPIRVIDNFVNANHFDRDVNKASDFVNQTYLEYRTFLSDAVTFVSCYRALEIICTRGFRFFQWNGRWMLVRLGMMQNIPFVGYYTEYLYDAAAGIGYDYNESYATYGFQQDIFPINRQQNKSMKVAVKSTQTNYTYTPWPEIPKNNKFERGELLSNIPLSLTKIYSIADWKWGKWQGNPTAAATLPDLFPTTSISRRRSVFNAYGVETQRQLELEDPNPADALRNILLSEGIPVIEGDKMEVNFEFRNSLNSSSGNVQVAMIMLIPDGETNPANYYFIDNADGGTYKWVIRPVGDLVTFINYPYTTDLRAWASFNINPTNAIPANGNVYIGLITQGFSQTSYYKGFDVKYTPYVAGGYLPVKADYWKTTQTKNFPAKADNEVFLSDNPHKIFKGCLLDSNGVPLPPDWHRMGVDEHKQYNELINFNEFNLEHRRMLQIEGPYKGVRFTTVDEPVVTQPIGLHKQYRLTDLDGDVRFILGPINMDLMAGRTQGLWYEVFAEGNNDGTTNATTEYKYKF